MLDWRNQLLIGWRVPPTWVGGLTCRAGGSAGNEALRGGAMGSTRWIAARRGLPVVAVVVALLAVGCRPGGGRPTTTRYQPPTSMDHGDPGHDMDPGDPGGGSLPPVSTTDGDG